MIIVLYYFEVDCSNILDYFQVRVGVVLCVEKEGGYEKLSEGGSAMVYRVRQFTHTIINVKKLP